MSSAASSSIRRLPLREAVSALKSGPGSITLSPNVAGVTLRFVAKNSEPGPRQFVRNHLPRLSYANPSLSFQVERIPDPRARHRDPKSPDAGAQWEGGVQPKPELTISFRSSPSQTVPITQLDGQQILDQLVAVAGENIPAGIQAPP